MREKERGSEGMPSDVAGARERLAAEIAAYTRSAPHAPTVRRRLLAALRAAGRTAPEIVAALRTNRHTLGRDLAAVRREAAARELATNRAACVPLLVEEAADAIQKVRAVLSTYDSDEDRRSTLYHNLVKLEFTMLVRFIELIGGPATPRTETKENEDEEGDWTKLSNRQLVEKAEGLGVDTTGFVRAFAAAGDPDFAAPDNCDAAA